MAIDKSKVAIGFIVAGAMTLMFGVISAIIGPTVMKDQVVKVSYILYWVVFFSFLSHLY